MCTSTPHRLARGSSLFLLSIGISLGFLGPGSGLCLGLCILCIILISIQLVKPVCSNTLQFPVLARVPHDTCIYYVRAS